MNPQKKLAVLVLLLCGLPSCTFSVPQAENALSQIQTLVARERPANEVLWLASYNGQGAVLKPYAAEGYTVFANESGDAVAFDGWVVRSVLGFGLEQVLTVSDSGWVRSSQSGKESFFAACSEWQKDNATKGYQWRQICGINGHETVISIDETGSISRIKQAFGGDLGTLTLNLRR
jgi:hypothetical protein